MAWVLTDVTHIETNISQKIVWCEETKCTVLTEEQISMMGDDLVRRIINHHNSSLKAVISNKECQDVLESVLGCFR